MSGAASPIPPSVDAAKPRLGGDPDVDGGTQLTPPAGTSVIGLALQEPRHPEAEPSIEERVNDGRADMRLVIDVPACSVLVGDVHAPFPIVKSVADLQPPFGA